MALKILRGYGKILTTKGGDGDEIPREHVQVDIKMEGTGERRRLILPYALYSSLVEFKVRETGGQ